MSIYYDNNYTLLDSAVEDNLARKHVPRDGPFPRVFS